MEIYAPTPRCRVYPRAHAHDRILGSIPADGPLSDTGPVISWLTNVLELGNSQSMQIGWNSNPALGPVGAARIEMGRITAIGTSNLRDGQWHHVAAMIVPRSAGRLQWHARLYVDGHLEEAPNRNTKKPRADTLEQPADDIVWLGCPANKVESHASHFCGDLDELFIADPRFAAAARGAIV